MSTLSNKETSNKTGEFLLLFDNMFNGYAYCKMVFDDNGKPTDFVYLEVNQAFKKLTGLNNVVGKKVTEVIPDIKKLNPELIEIYGRVAVSGKSEKLEIYFKPLSAYLSISIYSPEKGYFVAVFENITERMEALELLKKNEERLSLALKASNMGVWDWDIVVNKIYWSPELLKVTGKQSFEGTMEAFSKVIHPDDNERVMAAIQETVKTGKNFDIELRIINVKGGVIWMAATGQVYYDKDKKPVRMLGTTMDITERVEMISKLKARTEELEKFYKLAVDRELKMVELKNQLKSADGNQ